jgi:hypothetical protein
MNRILILIISLISIKGFTQCQNVAVKKDDMTDELRFSISGLNHINLLKFIEKGETTYYLKLSTTGNTANVSEKGVILLLSDNSKIVKPNIEIDVEVEMGHYYGNGDYEYSAFFRISELEVKQIIENPIKKFRLFIYDKDISDEKRTFYSETMKCIMTKS